MGSITPSRRSIASLRGACFERVARHDACRKVRPRLLRRRRCDRATDDPVVLVAVRPVEHCWPCALPLLWNRATELYRLSRLASIPFGSFRLSLQKPLSQASPRGYNKARERRSGTWAGFCAQCSSRTRGGQAVRLDTKHGLQLLPAKMPAAGRWPGRARARRDPAVGPLLITGVHGWTPGGGRVARSADRDESPRETQAASPERGEGGGHHAEGMDPPPGRLVGGWSRRTPSQAPHKAPQKRGSRVPAVKKVPRMGAAWGGGGGGGGRG